MQESRIIQKGMLGITKDRISDINQRLDQNANIEDLLKEARNMMMDDKNLHFLHYAQIHPAITDDLIIYKSVISAASYLMLGAGIRSQTVPESGLAIVNRTLTLEKVDKFSEIDFSEYMMDEIAEDSPDYSEWLLRIAFDRAGNIVNNRNKLELAGINIVYPLLASSIMSTFSFDGLIKKLEEKAEPS